MASRALTDREHRTMIITAAIAIGSALVFGALAWPIWLFCGLWAGALLVTAIVNGAFNLLRAIPRAPVAVYRALDNAVTVADDLIWSAWHKVRGR